MQKLIHFTVLDITNETAACKTFVLQPPEPFTYKAGQFLPFIFYRHGREVRRSYSFSSSPEADDFISITIKRTVNGEMSRWWMDEATIGSTLTSQEPAGMFTIEWQSQPRDIFLVAAGSGITPLFSLLKTALIREPDSRIHLVYSNSNVYSAIFYEQLQQLAKSYPKQLNIIWLFSDAASIFEARLGTFNLQRIIAKNLQFEKQDALVYTCGPYNYMLMVQITCRSMGISEGHIRRELFDIIEALPEAKKYFDEKNRVIRMHADKQQYVLDVPYNKTILDAALEKGIELPFNCKAGRCGTCVCKILNGKIWMHNNEVLTDVDIEQGLALTCTGHPASEDVEIII